jgi:hypothetical protein
MLVVWNPHVQHHPSRSPRFFHHLDLLLRHERQARYTGSPNSRVSLHATRRSGASLMHLSPPATTRGVRRSSRSARCAQIQPQCVEHLFGHRTSGVGSREPRAAARRGASNRDSGALFAPFRGQSPAISSLPGDASPCAPPARIYLSVRLTPLRPRRQYRGILLNHHPCDLQVCLLARPFTSIPPSPHPKDVQTSSRRASQ